MRIILYLIILIISGIFSFLTSGIEHFFKISDKNWYMIPLGYYVAGYSLIFYLIYKLKFNNVKILKFFLLRKIVAFNKFFNEMDIKVYSNRIELNSLQDKSINSWYILLKDKSTTLSYGVFESSYNKRTIQRGTLLMILKSNGSEDNLTIIDTETMNLYYEVFIPQAQSKEMILSFDKEQEKRMTSLENRKKAYIESIINIS